MTDVVIPASLGVWSTCKAEPEEVACALFRFRDSTRVQGPSFSIAGGLLRLVLGRGTGVDDSGAVADDSDCASAGIVRLPPAALDEAAAAFFA